MRLTAGLILSLAAYPAAGDISLALPIECTLGETCHIQQFVDRDPTSGAVDFQCGSLAYDGHKGTDFALPTLADQAAGVAVLAAAEGTVVALRDSVPDILQGSPGAPDVTDIECGNGVVIRHPDGWETQYCHMALGSIAVRVNQTVQTGDTLGFVGLSGNTQFPHLHLEVRHNGAAVDPFSADSAATCGAAPTTDLWQPDLPVAAGGFIYAGFATAIPDYDAIKAGTAAVANIQSNDPALVVWGFAFGSRSGDTFSITITGPQGVVFDQTDVLDRTQAQFFRAGGKRTPTGGWPVGTYTGDMSLTRDGTIIDTQSVSIMVN